MVLYFYINKYLDIEITAKETSHYRTYLDERVKHSIRIVLGGGVELIDHLSDELKQKNPLPVIFVRGSGGVADIIAYAYR